MSKNDDGDRVHLGGGAVYDKDLLGGSASKRSSGYVASIETGNDVDEDEDEMDTGAMPQLGIRQINAPTALLNKLGTTEEANFDPFAETRRDKSIASRQNEYQQKRLTARQISPERIDPFAGKFFLFFCILKAPKMILVRRKASQNPTSRYFSYFTNLYFN
jgi:hypothetical protein